MISDNSVNSQCSLGLGDFTERLYFLFLNPSFINFCNKGKRKCHRNQNAIVHHKKVSKNRHHSSQILLLNLLNTHYSTTIIFELYQIHRQRFEELQNSFYLRRLCWDPIVFTVNFYRHGRPLFNKRRSSPWWEMLQRFPNSSLSSFFRPRQLRRWQSRSTFWTHGSSCLLDLLPVQEKYERWSDL